MRIYCTHASASEARETMTKFLVIIVIAVSLEALVFILGAANDHLSLLVYPAILLSDGRWAGGRFSAVSAPEQFRGATLATAMMVAMQGLPR
jgi:hypothetical protein